MSIKTLSPSFKIIPWVSPNSGLTSTSYLLKIFAWQGLKTAQPITSLFEITKNNAEDSTGNDEINISRLVNSTFDFAAQTSSGTTQLLDGNNQAWIRTVVFYTTADTDELTLGQIIDVSLMLKGFGGGMDGKNPDTPSNKILIPVNDYNVDKDNGRFVVPIQLDETTNTLDAVDDTFNIFFLDTTLDVLANDDLGFQPTVIFSVDDSSFPSTAGTLSIENSTIKYNVGSVLETPLTATYTIKDVTGATDTATITINITGVPSVVTAVDDFYFVNEIDQVNLTVQDNDVEGTPPTTITAIDQSGITSGTLAIDGTNEFIIFTPNGFIPASDETFTYDLTDTLTTDVGTVTLNVTLKNPPASGQFFTNTTGQATSLLACPFAVKAVRYHDGIFTLPVAGDLIFTDSDMTILFDGGSLWYRIQDNKTIQINAVGLVIEVELC